MLHDRDRSTVRCVVCGFPRCQCGLRSRGGLRVDADERNRGMFRRPCRRCAARARGGGVEGQRTERCAAGYLHVELGRPDLRDAKPECRTTARLVGCCELRARPSRGIVDETRFWGRRRGIHEHRSAAIRRCRHDLASGRPSRRYNTASHASRSACPRWIRRPTPPGRNQRNGAHDPLTITLASPSSPR